MAMGGWAGPCSGEEGEVDEAEEEDVEEERAAAEGAEAVEPPLARRSSGRSKPPAARTAASRPVALDSASGGAAGLASELPRPVANWTTRDDLGLPKTWPAARRAASPRRCAGSVSSSSRDRFCRLRTIRRQVTSAAAVSRSSCGRVTVGMDEGARDR